MDRSRRSKNFIFTRMFAPKFAPLSPSARPMTAYPNTLRTSPMLHRLREPLSLSWPIELRSVSIGATRRSLAGAHRMSPLGKSSSHTVVVRINLKCDWLLLIKERQTWCVCDQPACRFKYRWVGRRPLKISIFASLLEKRVDHK